MYAISPAIHFSLSVNSLLRLPTSRTEKRNGSSINHSCLISEKQRVFSLPIRHSSHCARVFRRRRHKLFSSSVRQLCSESSSTTLKPSRPVRATLATDPPQAGNARSIPVTGRHEAASRARHPASRAGHPRPAADRPQPEPPWAHTFALFVSTQSGQCGRDQLASAAGSREHAT